MQQTKTALFILNYLINSCKDPVVHWVIKYSKNDSIDVYEL